MPKPKPGEEKEDFLERCVNVLIHEENRDPKQAVAICYDYWEEKKKK